MSSNFQNRHHQLSLQIYFSLIVLMKSKTHHSKVKEPQTFFSAVPKIKHAACVWQVSTLSELYLQAYKQEFLGESHTTSFQLLCHRKARDNLCADLPEVWAAQLPHTKLLHGATSLRGSQKMKSKELKPGQQPHLGKCTHPPKKVIKLNDRDSEDSIKTKTTRTNFLKTVGFLFS